MGPFTSALIAQLNAGPFVSFLEELTGIGGLVPDPHLRGGGLHEIRQVGCSACTLTSTSIRGSGSIGD